MWQKQTEYVIPPPPEAKAGDLKGSLLRSKFKSTYFNTIFGAEPEESTADNNENNNNTQISVRPESDTVQHGDDNLDTRPTIVELTSDLLPPSWLRNSSDLSADVATSQAVAPSPRSRIANHRHTIRRVSSFDDIDHVRQQNNLEAQYSLESTLDSHRVPELAPLRRRHSSETLRPSIEHAQSSHDQLMRELANELKDELEPETKESGSASEARAETEAKEIPAVVEQENQEQSASDNNEDSDLC